MSSFGGDQLPPPSTSMGPPSQPSTSGAQLNVQTSMMPPPQHPGPMRSPHPPQPDHRYAPYPYGGKPMAMQRPPQQWQEGGQPDYSGQYPPQMYGAPPPGQAYWQQPRYMLPQQYPPFGPSPGGYYQPPPMQGTPNQPPVDWRMPVPAPYPQPAMPVPAQPAPLSNQTVVAALQSPGASSSLGQEDSMDDTKSVRSTNSVPPPQTPQRASATPVTPGPSTKKSESTPSSKNPPQYNRQEVLEKLVQTTVAISPELMNQRRAFFERILIFAEQAGEPMLAAPQVSKSPIDLHRLYLACKAKGGFEQVTKDKAWKLLCVEANPEMSESSAAGYQLRRHYQKHLLHLECMETGKNHDELVAFAEKTKKKKKDKEPVNAASGSSTPAPPVPQMPMNQPTPTAPPMAQPPPQGFGTHQGNTSQPGPSFPVDGNGQPIPPYNPSYNYPGGPPPGSWISHGFPPQYQQRFPPPPQGLPGTRPPMDQTAFEEYQKQQQQQQQMHFQQQQQQQQQQQGAQMRPPPSVPPSTPSLAPPPIPPVPSQAPGEAATPVPSASSRAPSAAPPASIQPPTSEAQLPNQPGYAPPQQPMQSQQPLPTEPPSMSVANQMGQPPMPYYPPQMGMYMQRMPNQGYPQPPNGFQPPGPDSGQMPPPQPNLYGQPPPGHPMFQQNQWNQQQQMMRPPGPPGPYPNQQQDYWQRQNQQQQQQLPGPARKPFPPAPVTQQSQPSPGQQQQQQKQSVAPTVQVPPNQPIPPPRPPQKPAQAAMVGVAGPPVPFQPPQPHHLTMQPPQQHPQHHSFPPGTVESISQHFLGPQRRPMKKTTRELIGVNPRRMLMALRSDMHLESVWALNALTVMLYDDNINPVPLTGELLCLIMEHFYASLALVFPKVFELPEINQINEFISNSSEMDFWNETVEKAKIEGEELKTMVKLPAHKTTVNKSINLNEYSRNGIKIVVKDSQMPRKLKRWRPSTSKPKERVETPIENPNAEERNRCGLPSDFATRLAMATKAFVEQQSSGHDRLKFSLLADDRLQHLEYDEDVQPKPFQVPGLNSDEIETSNEEETRKYDYDPDAPYDCALVPRPIGLFLIPQNIQDYASLCLAWSNVIRGFAFNSVNEQLLAAHNGLLRIIGNLLMLYVESEGQSTLISRRKQKENDEKDGIIEPKQTTPEEDVEARKKEAEKRAAMVATPKDEIKSYLLDVANQLRDDAFTVLSVVSGSLNMYDMEPDISYQILDALLHWTVSKSIMARDPLTSWGNISPKNFCLEIIGKMTVLEKNVDMLLSTGSWERLEEFVKVVSGFVNMGEEPQIREFALVIMNAICQASELACIVAAYDTELVKNTIMFLEFSDAAMFNVVTQHGMHYLKENQEVIGTTFGMLRRACSLLYAIIEHKECKQPFVGNISTLINLTLSHYMDTRVAGMVAAILHLACQANIDSETGKNMDVPETPSVEPQILFPGKYVIPKIRPKDDDSKYDRATSSKQEPKEFGKLLKEMDCHSNLPSSSTQVQTFENGSPGGYSNGINGHDVELRSLEKHVNGVCKDVKAILRNSIHNKQHDDPNPAKKSRLEVNGTNGIPRLNGSSPSSQNNANSNTNSSSNMAIVT